MDDVTLNVKVSFVIPCYNMEKWIEETVQSCLDQKDIDPEVIVIDDGSKDRSVEVLKQFGQKIYWETGPNKGVNPSRNRGLSLATGKYILFLDADDKLESNILAHQVRLLEVRKADVCYGDWRHLWMTASGGTKIMPVSISGEHSDMVKALLAGWWCPPFSYLYKRDFILSHGLLWNETLGFPDDFEYILRVCLKDPTVIYLPKNTGFYRQHNVGTRLSEIAVTSYAMNMKRILQLAEDELRRKNQWEEPYIEIICGRYLNVARNVLRHSESVYRGLIEKTLQIKPNFLPPQVPYRWLVRLFGYERTERIWELKYRLWKIKDGLLRYYKGNGGTV